MTDAEAWSAEERLWLEGPEAFRALVHAEAALVFAGPGILRGDAVATSLEGAPRWQRVGMSHGVVIRPADGVLVLVYQADAERAGSLRYLAWCSSTWVCAAQGWQLVQHQQTPAP